MGSKKIKLGGFGEIVLNPINMKEKEYELVDSEGEALTKIAGTRKPTTYKTKKGVEIPQREICKKFVIDGEDIVSPKITPTSEVAKEDIETIDDNGLIYNAINRKFYNVFTESEKLNKLIMEDGKTLMFPLVCGLGWKCYNGLLTRWKDRIILVGCQGDINEALEQYKDETIDFEIDILPQKNAKKLLKALVVA